jgi:hypothetical protein
MHSQGQNAGDLQELPYHCESRSICRRLESPPVAQQAGKGTIAVRNVFFIVLDHLPQRLGNHRQGLDTRWNLRFGCHDTRLAWPYAACVAMPMQRRKLWIPITRQGLKNSRIHNLTSNMTQAKDARRKESRLQQSGQRLRSSRRPWRAF